VVVQKPRAWKLRKGASVAVQGVCSTVRNITSGTFEVAYMPETLKKTTVGNLRKDAIVNLEQSMRLGDELGGHLVQGHVDCVAEIVNVAAAGESVVMEFTIPKRWMRYLAPKGSVAVDGVSLTVVDVHHTTFTVSLSELYAHPYEFGNIAQR